MTSALQLIPHVIQEDPQLANDLLALEHYFICSLVVILQRKRKREESDREQMPPPKKARRFWVRPYLQRRRLHGDYDTLLNEFVFEEPTHFKNYLRMDLTIFKELAERVRPLIEKQTTNFREPLSVGLRLAITIRFLATGASYKSLGYAFRVAPNTISKVVPETCRAIVAVLGDEVLKMPTTPEGWKEVAKGFEQKWNLPHCIGAIDGKHIRIRNPAHAGSLYFNYKKFFSVVLMAVVDSDYKFIYVDVGACGSESDAGIYAQSSLAHMLHNQSANLPAAEPIQGEPTGRPTEYFLVGDDAFALRTYLMKPFPDRGLSVVERVYNYRITRARRVVENAFGILAARFRVFLTSMALQPEKVEDVIMAACCLHNLLRIRMPNPHDTDREDPNTHEVIPAPWRGQLSLPTLQMSNRRITALAKSQRQFLAEYFSSEAGQIPWQLQRI